MEIFVLSLIGIGMMVGGAGVTSLIHHSRQRHYLEKKLPIDNTLKTKVANIIGVDEGVIIGVSAFDVFYNISKMDPHALTGISHLHHNQEFGNLGDLIAYMKENIIISEYGSKVWRQMVHKYKGYAGEEMAFDNLRDAEYTVVVPESGTTEGFDAIVDGRQMNVKITDNPAYIHDHLDAHPDIPVYTNMEMEQAFADNPNVIIDPNLSAQDIFHETADTLDGIDDIGDLIDQIPYITLAISTVKNAKGVFSGDKGVLTALEHITGDCVAVGFGGLAGSKIGLGIGLALAPVTGGISAIVIPAATTIVGTLIGIFTGKGIVGWFKQRHLRAAIEQLKLKATDLCQYFLNGVDRIHVTVDGYYNRMVLETKQAYREDKEGFFKRIFFPGILSKFYQMSISYTKKERGNVKKYYGGLYKKVLKKAREPVGIAAGGLLVYAQGETIFNGNKKLLEKYKEVGEALNRVEKEKKKLV